jgi:hypothetical protein
MRTPSQRAALRGEAMQFAQGQIAHAFAITVFMDIFDYWSTGKDDWEVAFKDTAAPIAGDIFEEFLVDYLEADTEE